MYFLTLTQVFYGCLCLSAYKRVCMKSTELVLVSGFGECTSTHQCMYSKGGLVNNVLLVITICSMSVCVYTINENTRTLRWKIQTNI